jgi:hypothetical protein
MSTGSEQEVIACLLSEREQAERAEAAHRDLFPGVQAFEELPDGYGYRFPATEEWSAKIMAVVEAERQCRSFFTFEVVFESYGRGLWLRLRGSEEIKTFIENNFPLTLHATDALR